MEQSNPEKVVSVIRDRSGSPVCDDCIAKLAGISNRIAVNPIATALGLTSDFNREKGECSECHSAKLVTNECRTT